MKDKIIAISIVVFFIVLAFMGAILKSSFNLDGSMDELFSEDNIYKALRAFLVVSCVIGIGLYIYKKKNQ